MWMIELAMNTKTDERRIGSQSAVSAVMIMRIPFLFRRSYIESDRKMSLERNLSGNRLHRGQLRGAVGVVRGDTDRQLRELRQHVRIAEGDVDERLVGRDEIAHQSS